MKKQPMESKIAAGYGESGGASPETMDSLREESQIAEARAKIEAIKQKNRNKVAELLDGKVWIREWTHPCLLHPELKRQLTVYEFYPDLNVGVDKFFHFDAWELKLTEFKRQAMNDAGFKYVYLTPDKDMSDVIADLETQKLK